MSESGSCPYCREDYFDINEELDIPEAVEIQIEEYYRECKHCKKTFKVLVFVDANYFLLEVKDEELP